MKSLLPIILMVLALTGAITYSLAKKATQVKKDVNRFGISANQLENSVVPQFKFNTDNAPTPSAPIISPTVMPIATPTASPSAAPQTSAIDTETNTKGGQVIADSNSKSSTIKTTVCTPVYGMANTCTEHVVVDTGAEDSIFFNLAGLSYIGGLVSLVRAKTLKK